MKTVRVVAAILVLVAVFSGPGHAGASLGQGAPGGDQPPAAPAGTVIDLGTPPGKVGSGLTYLMMTRAYEPARRGKELLRVLSYMDQKGGADAAIVFDPITAVGGSGSSTPLNISITTLSNSDGADMPATDVDGTVNIS